MTESLLNNKKGKNDFIRNSVARDSGQLGVGC